MTAVTIHYGKTNLSQLIARVEAGEEIALARGKNPVAKLVPREKPAGRRQPGAYRGKCVIDPASFDPMTEEELAPCRDRTATRSTACRSPRRRWTTWSWCRTSVASMPAA
jgi:hypothetical protein